MAKLKKDRPKAVVDGKEVQDKPKRRLPQLGKMGKKIVASFVVLVLIAGLAYWKFFKPKSNITIDGQTYKVHLLTTPNNLTNGPAPGSINVQAQIDKLEATAAKDPSYSNYIALAQLYAQNQNPTKAVENYKKAKSALDPKTPNYSSVVKAIDNLIESLQG